MYSNIKVYQKYLVTSIKVGCATRSLYASSGPKAEGVPTNNQRGRGSGPCRLWGGLDKAKEEQEQKVEKRFVRLSVMLIAFVTHTVWVKTSVICIAIN